MFLVHKNSESVISPNFSDVITQDLNSNFKKEMHGWTLDALINPYQQQIEKGWV